MSVFVVRHQHPADRCPAADFTAGAGLLNHLSRPSAARHGVRVRGEAVLAAHTLVMIAEADSEAELRAFCGRSRRRARCRWIRRRPARE
jgi:hypothetical protein